MTTSRLYYDVKELSAGILKFRYYTDEISENFADLKSFTKQINQKEVYFTFYNVGIQNMLYNINAVEFSRLLKEIEKYKDHVDELGRTDAIEANIAIAKLWGPSELQRKFVEWFEKNGYSIPNGN